jgi:diguanylate cyclase
MRSNDNNFDQLHWLLGILHNIDVGLVVIDADYTIQLWNGFMENHSSRKARDLIGTNLFEQFPELPHSWLERKLNSVFQLNNRSSTTWEQRPFLFEFESYQPITSRADWMYQDLTLLPLTGLDGSVGHVCLVIYDVTGFALDEIALNNANAKLAKLSQTDGLTGLNNRRTWEDQVRQEFRRCVRSGGTSSLIMLDIDHFKKVNDTYGHQAGDEVIRRIALLLSENQRATDITGRYGGEEFGIVLLDTDSQGAMTFAERLRGKIEAMEIEYEGISIRCTISLGIAEIPRMLEDYQYWIARADKALYRSKEEGRNRTTLHR